MKNTGVSKMMDKKKRVRKIAIILVCILIPVGAFGFGYFWNRDDKDSQVANTLSVNGNITGSITKDADVDTTGMVPGDQVEATININPTSTEDSLLRVKVEPYWKNEDSNGDLLDNSNLKLIEGTLVKTNMSEGSWYKSKDYYYYIGAVGKNTQNEISLIKGIELTPSNKANAYQNNQVGIKVTMEIVQARGKVYKQKWNLKSEDASDLQIINKLDEYAPDSKTIN